MFEKLWVVSNLETWQKGVFWFVFFRFQCFCGLFFVCLVSCKSVKKLFYSCLFGFGRFRCFVVFACVFLCSGFVFVCFGFVFVSCWIVVGVVIVFGGFCVFFVLFFFWGGGLFFFGGLRVR